MRAAVQSFLPNVSGKVLRCFALLVLCITARGAMAQAPYVLPYTMTTLVGTHPLYTGTFPQFCSGTSGPMAYDTFGDGCPASQFSMGIEPHDVRVDGFGNVYWLDDSSSSNIIVHRYNPKTGLVTVYTGGASSKCATGSDADGNTCLASDNLANLTTDSPPGGYTGYTTKMSARGLGMAPNNDLYIAGYNASVVWKVSYATHQMNIVAGTLSGVSNLGDGGSATASEMSKPRGVGPDGSGNGNIWIADTGNSAIRKVTASTGYISTVGGSLNGGPSTGGQADSAGCNNGPIATSTFNAPEDAQTDSFGNVYVADQGNSTIRALYNGSGTLPNNPGPLTAGYWYTVAGNCNSATQGTYSPGMAQVGTLFNLPIRKLSIDKYNNLFLADSNNQVVWFVDHVTGYVRVIAGMKGKTVATCGPASPTQIGDTCPATQASLDSTSDMGVSTDPYGNIFITDLEGATDATGGAPATYNARIREVVNGLNFAATAAGSTLTQTVEIHVNPVGGVGGAPDTIATGAFVIKGSTDFTVTSVPAPVVNADNTSDYVVTLQFAPTRPGLDNALLTVTTGSGLTNSFAITGTGTAPSVAIDPGYTTKLPAAAAPFVAPAGAFADASGNYYIADSGSNRVYFYNATSSTLVIAGTSAPAGTTTTIAGSGGTASYPSGDNGPATSATLKAPTAVTVDGSGNIFIADTGNNVIRRVDAVTGVISTYAGSGTGSGSCFTNNFNTDAVGNGCPATQAILTAPAGVAIDTYGNLYLSDQTVLNGTAANSIREVTTKGYIFSIAGGTTPCITTPSGGQADTYGNGCWASGNAGTNPNPIGILLSSPAGLAIDAANNLYIADKGDNMVRKLNLGTTLVTDLAGTGQAGSSTSNGNVAASSQLNAPQGVGVDAGGNVYIADTGNGTIRLVTGGTTSPGLISTIAGTNGATGTGTVPGYATQAYLASPTGIAVAAAGTLAIADTGNARVLADNRTQVAYNFGFTNVTNPATTVTLPTTITELVTGTAATTLGSPLFTTSGNTSTNGSSGLFTLTASSTSGCAPGLYAIGLTCNLVAQFTPTTSTLPNTITATYNESTTTVNNPVTPPQVVLSGVGVVQIKTTPSIQLSTVTPQFGAPLTATATITPASCSPFPAICAPTGTVSFTVDNGQPGASVPLAPNAGNATSSSAPQPISNLTVGTHTIYVTYSGDTYYAGSTTMTTPTTITVTTAATSTMVSISPASSQQFTTTKYTATVLSTTTGTPTGSVTFYSNGIVLGTAQLGGGTASLTQQLNLNADGSTFDPSTSVAPPFVPTLTLPYAVSSLSTALVSTFSIASNVATFIAPNTFTAGQTISLYGFNTNISINGQQLALNGQTATVLATGLSSTQFEVNFTYPNVPPTAASSTAPLPPGTYSITATYSGDSNFNTSTSAASSLTVTPDTAALQLASRSCNEINIAIANTGYGSAAIPTGTCASETTAGLKYGTPTNIAGGIATPATGAAGGTITAYLLCPAVSTSSPCNNVAGSTSTANPNPFTFVEYVTFNEANTFTGGIGQVVTVSGSADNFFNTTYTVLTASSTQWSGLLNSYVATAQGATTDATVFIRASNTLTGTLTFSCAGMPANSGCTFNPTSMVLTPNTNVPSYVPLIVTFFTDLQPGTAALHTPALRGHKTPGITLALLLGWPVTLAGLAGMTRFRKRKGTARSLTLLSLLLLMIGSSSIFTSGCSGGPGAYQPVFTPAGTYPITITVTNGTISSSIIVNLAVYSPGIAGAE